MERGHRAGESVLFPYCQFAGISLSRFIQGLDKQENSILGNSKPDGDIQKSRITR